MKFILDTHAFLWFASNDAKLSARARAEIQDPRNIIHVSPASHWEIAIKISTGKYRLNSPYEDFWRVTMLQNKIDVMPKRRPMTTAINRRQVDALYLSRRKHGDASMRCRDLRLR